jgi:AcrR family transcriptional regulator
LVAARLERQEADFVAAPKRYGTIASTAKTKTRVKESAETEGGDVTTRQLIIEAASRAFAKNGFDATTNKMIAQSAGVAPGLLYHYFESKEALFATVYLEITRYRYERSSAVMRSEATFGGKIEALARDLVEMWTHDSPYVEFHARTLYESQHEGRLTEALVAAREETEQQWNTIVEDAKMRGDLPFSVSTQAVTDMCIGWFTGVVMLLPSRGAERTLASTGVFVSAVQSLGSRDR